MPPLPRDLLAQPAADAARAIVLGYLDAAAKAAARLGQPRDTEALHDFRVAIRRVRATLRAYRTLLEGSVRKKHRRRLRELARATNRGRDAEVQVAWLQAHAGSFASAERAELTLLRKRLEARRRRAYARARTEVRRRFLKLERRLRRRLTAEARPSGAAAPRLAAIAAPALRQHAADLRARLSAVTSVADAAESHAARIAAKRLRYLLEPIAAEMPAGDALVRRLKQLQDHLGKTADAHVLERDAGDTEAVGRLVRAELEELFAALRADWLGEGARQLERDVDAGAAGIDGSSRTAPPSVRARPRIRRRRGSYSPSRGS